MTRSSGTVEAALSTDGTPSFAAARASATLPSKQQSPDTPIGAMPIGDANVTPKRSTDCERFDTSTSGRVRKRQRPKAARLTSSEAWSSEPPLT